MIRKKRHVLVSSAVHRLLIALSLLGGGCHCYVVSTTPKQLPTVNERGDKGYFSHVQLPGSNSYEFEFHQSNDSHSMSRLQQVKGAAFRVKVAWKNTDGNEGEQLLEYNHEDKTASKPVSNNNNDHNYHNNHNYDTHVPSFVLNGEKYQSLPHAIAEDDRKVPVPIYLNQEKHPAIILVKSPEEIQYFPSISETDSHHDNHHHDQHDATRNPHKNSHIKGPSQNSNLKEHSKPTVTSDDQSTYHSSAKFPSNYNNPSEFHYSTIHHFLASEENSGGNSFKNGGGISPTFGETYGVPSPMSADGIHSINVQSLPSHLGTGGSTKTHNDSFEANLKPGFNYPRAPSSPDSRPTHEHDSATRHPAFPNNNYNQGPDFQTIRPTHQFDSDGNHGNYHTQKPKIKGENGHTIAIFPTQHQTETFSPTRVPLQRPSLQTSSHHHGDTQQSPAPNDIGHHQIKQVTPNYAGFVENYGVPYTKPHDSKDDHSSNEAVELHHSQPPMNHQTIGLHIFPPRGKPETNLNVGNLHNLDYPAPGPVKLTPISSHHFSGRPGFNSHNQNSHYQPHDHIKGYDTNSNNLEPNKGSLYKPSDNIKEYDPHSNNPRLNSGSPYKPLDHTKGFDQHSHNLGPVKSSPDEPPNHNHQSHNSESFNGSPSKPSNYKEGVPHFPGPLKSFTYKPSDLPHEMDPHANFPGPYKNIPNELLDSTKGFDTNSHPPSPFQSILFKPSDPTKGLDTHSDTPRPFKNSPYKPSYRPLGFDLRHLTKGFIETSPNVVQYKSPGIKIEFDQHHQSQKPIKTSPNMGSHHPTGTNEGYDLQYHSQEPVSTSPHTDSHHPTETNEEYDHQYHSQGPIATSPHADPHHPTQTNEEYDHQYHSQGPISTSPHADSNHPTGTNEGYDLHNHSQKSAGTSPNIPPNHSPDGNMFHAHHPGLVRTPTGVPPHRDAGFEPDSRNPGASDKTPSGHTHHLPTSNDEYSSNSHPIRPDHKSPIGLHLFTPVTRLIPNFSYEGKHANEYPPTKSHVSNSHTGTGTKNDNHQRGPYHHGESNHNYFPDSEGEDDDILIDPRYIHDGNIQNPNHNKATASGSVLSEHHNGVPVSDDNSSNKLNKHRNNDIHTLTSSLLQSLPQTKLQNAYPQLGNQRPQQHSVNKNQQQFPFQNVNNNDHIEYNENQGLHFRSSHSKFERNVLASILNQSDDIRNKKYLAKHSQFVTKNLPADTTTTQNPLWGDLPEFVRNYETPQAVPQEDSTLPEASGDSEYETKYEEQDLLSEEEDEDEDEGEGERGDRQDNRDSAYEGDEESHGGKHR